MSYFQPFRSEDNKTTHLCELCHCRLRLVGGAASSNAKTHLQLKHKQPNFEDLPRYGDKRSLASTVNQCFHSKASTSAATAGSGMEEDHDEEKTPFEERLELVPEA